MGTEPQNQPPPYQPSAGYPPIQPQLQQQQQYGYYNQGSQPHQPPLQPPYPSQGPAPATTSPTQILIVNSNPYLCPAGGEHVYTKQFTLPGICCAFWFFPAGILCCLGLMEDRCTKCGQVLY